LVTIKIPCSVAGFITFGFKLDQKWKNRGDAPESETQARGAILTSSLGIVPCPAKGVISASAFPMINQSLPQQRKLRAEQTPFSQLA
jgi:hypothetical protein